MEAIATAHTTTESSLGSSWEIASNNTIRSDKWEVVSEVDISERPITIEGDLPYVSIDTEEGRKWLEGIQQDTQRMTKQMLSVSDDSDMEHKSSMLEIVSDV